jgi:chemotaxis protein MotB
MVMWLLASTDAKSRKEISNYFRSGILPEGDLSMNTAAQITPSVMEMSSTPPPQGKESIDVSKNVGEKLGKLAALDTQLADVIKNVKVSVTPDGVLVEAVDEGKGLMFDLASSQLTEPLQRFLRSFAHIVVSVGKPVEINGHTDARPFPAGSRLSNWDLSYQRAAAAREIMESSGMPTTMVIGVFARGSSQLYVPDDPYASQNRRLSFLIRTAKAPVSLADEAMKPQ